jgi:hypothetical protein
MTIELTMSEQDAAIKANLDVRGNFLHTDRFGTGFDHAALAVLAERPCRDEFDELTRRGALTLSRKIENLS